MGQGAPGATPTTPICLDETLRSESHARQTAELMVADWNIKVHRVADRPRYVGSIGWPRPMAPICGRHHALFLRIGSRWNRRGGATPLCVPIGPGAVGAVVRPQRRRGQADHGKDGRMAVPAQSVAVHQGRFRAAVVAARRLTRGFGSALMEQVVTCRWRLRVNRLVGCALLPLPCAPRWRMLNTRRPSSAKCTGGRSARSAAGARRPRPACGGKPNLYLHRRQ